MTPAGTFVGLTTIDIVYLIDHVPSSDEKIVAKTQRISAGGPATNAAIVFAQLGGQSTLYSSLGRHGLATIATREFEAYGIDFHDLHPDSADLPPFSSVLVSEATGERAVVSTNAVARQATPESLGTATFAVGSTLLVDGHQLEASIVSASAARNAGAAVILDGGSWKQGLEQLLRHVDVAICSARFFPPGTSNWEDVLEYLLGCGVTHCAITRGPLPIEYVMPHARGRFPVPQVGRVVDTLGAGDVLHGAFCYHFAANRNDFLGALSQSSRLASEVCTQQGIRDLRAAAAPEAPR